MTNINTAVIRKKAKLLSCILVCLFIFLTGCASNHEPMPVITEVSPHADIQMLTPPVTVIEKDTDDDITADWIPSGKFEDKNLWKGIIIHHSALDYGSADYVDLCHKLRGFDGIGYDFVINNGLIKEGYGQADGLVEASYRWRTQTTGAHCKDQADQTNYWNEHTIGICLIGNFENTKPTEAQWDSLVKLIRFLQNRYDIDFDQIKGHRDIKPTKCPGKNFTLNELKRRLTK